MKFWLALSLTLLLLSATPLRAQATLDTIVFGNSTSETAHGFSGTNSFVVTNNAISPAQTARRCLSNSAAIYGGDLTVTLAVDPAWRNYFSLKLWGGDDVSATTGQASDMGRLYLYVPASNYVAGATTNYQIGYRHEGDYICLSITSYKPPLSGRFFYSTTLLPLWMTQGRTNLTFKIVSTGRVYPLGSGVEPTGNYQFLMKTNSRAIYQAYTHTDPVLNPAGEVQGAAPTTTVRPTPTVSTLSPGGTYYNGVSNYLSGRLSTSVTNFTTVDFMQLAKAYSLSNFPVSYTNPALVTKIIAAADDYASNYYANPSTANGWGGNFGNIGWAIHLLLPQLQSSLDATNDFGAGGNISRRQAWGDLLLASREYGRFNRNTLSNQGLISGTSIYWANRALLDLGNASAFNEADGQRYLMEAIGIAPWLGSDLVGGGSEAPFGTNYFQVTPKGLSREWGYVGTAYGEMAFYAADFYSWTTNPVFLAQAVKMVKARAIFRRPAIEVSGSSNYRCLEGIGLLAWRGATESDGDYSTGTAYGDRTAWALGVRCAAVTLDPDVVGYAKQMLADNQYFNTLTGGGSIGNQGDSRDALDVFHDYPIVASTPDSGVRVPMTDGQPDFAWADEENGIVAIKRGSERLWLAAYWQAKAGTGVNGVGRFHYSTNNFDRYGVLETSPQINFGGSFYVRPNLMDKPEQNIYTPPDNPLQAYQGERLPLAASDPLATTDDPFRGKALFWAARYGNYLIGINRSTHKAYQLQTPADFVSATNLVTGQNLSGPIYVAPQSTVVLYLSSATDPCPTPPAPLSLNAVGNAAPRIVLDWSAASGALGYNVKRATSSGGPYVTLANVTTTNYTDTTVTKGAAYYYVVTGTNTCGESPYPSMEALASAGLPSPWLEADTGSVGTAGSADYRNGTFSVDGAGSDIGAGSDSFHFCYLNLTNSGSITVRLVSQTLGKVGVMMRNTTNANSVMAAVLIDLSSYKARFATRTSAGAWPTWQDSSETVTAPRWLRVVRSGSSFSGYCSTDGVNWTQLGTSVSVTMNSAILIGLAACSRNTSQLTAAVFDNVTAANWTPPPAAPATLTATGSVAQIALSWTASANATGYNIRRAATSGGDYTTIASRGGTSYTNIGLPAGTTYYYAVTATNAAGESAESTAAAATTLAPPSVPAVLTAAAGDGRVVLGWTSVTHADSYSLKRSTTAGSGYATVAGNLTGLSFTNTGLVNGTRYYYVVAATNAAGASGDSSEASARPVSQSPPTIGRLLNGGRLQFDWPPDHVGWRLESQTNTAGTGLGTNWFAVPGSENTNQWFIPVDAGNGSVFYRLVYP